MTVQQILLYEVPKAEAGTEEPVAFGAVATDGEQAVSSFSDSVPEGLSSGLAENFTVKVDLVKKHGTGEFENVMEVLRYNLYFPTSEIREYDTFEEAQAAAQGAFNA